MMAELNRDDQGRVPRQQALPHRPPAHQPRPDRQRGRDQDRMHRRAPPGAELELCESGKRGGEPVDGLTRLVSRGSLGESEKGLIGSVAGQSRNTRFTDHPDRHRRTGLLQAAPTNPMVRIRAGLPTASSQTQLEA